MKYRTVGNPGSQQLIFERIGVEYPGSNNNAARIEYQIVLTEGSNEITVHIRQATTATHSATIGIQAENAPNRGLHAAYWAARSVPQLSERAFRFVPW